MENLNLIKKDKTGRKSRAEEKVMTRDKGARRATPGVFASRPSVRLSLFSVPGPSGPPRVPAREEELQFPREREK